MRKKRVIASVVALSLIVSVFASCTREQDIADTTASEVQETKSAIAQITQESTTLPPVTTTQDETTTIAKPISTKKPTITKKAPTTKKPTSTKKAPATKKPTTYTSNMEVAASSVIAKAKGTTVLRAWRLNKGDVSIEVHKLAFGSPKKRTFDYKNNTGKRTRTLNYQEVCNVAIISCPPERVNSQCAEQLLNKDEGLTFDMARSAGALIAVNGEYYEGHWSPAESKFFGDGPVVRNGKVVNGKTAASNGFKPFTMNKDGTWSDQMTVNGDNVNELIKNGLRFTLYEANKVIWNGKKTFSNSDKNHNRTMFGQIDKNHYVMAVGEFISIDSMIGILLDYGAQKAFMLNGGNCSYMYLKGVGNVTGTISPKLKHHDKINMLEQEFYGLHELLGEGRDRPLGEACPAKDIMYIL
ncbi:MAG TPA: phosphodiester glycosidase family protein [Clostridia bacterium]|nr:phosphodiester glycosidase family protein [Clostridia bacterium]